MVRIRFPKYSLQTLLFVVLCAGGFMAAYRLGLDRGYADGKLKRYGERYLPRTYFVEELAGPNGVYSAKELESLLETSIEPSSWDRAGGPASVDFVVDRDGNPVFVITQQSSVHDRITALFEELRDGNEGKASQ
jgi:hypothetical protein